MPPTTSTVAVIGSGYVGTVVAACLAHVGHTVIGVETDAAKLDVLRSGRAPFFEPGLDPLMEAGVRDGNLTFTSDLKEATVGSEVVFICVGTPAGPDGYPDMSAMESVVHALASGAAQPRVIVTKSTVPIGTGRWLGTSINEALADSAAPHRVSIVSNPEFLREGCAVDDFLHPERVVLGGEDEEALDAVEAIYRPILEQRIFDGNLSRSPVPLVRTATATAEMIKYASNAFLATKISFANEIARICDFVGADVTDVTAGMGLDSRIGPGFLGAGLGWGGSCFGKDLTALISTAGEYDYTPLLLKASVAVNAQQRDLVLAALLRHLKTFRGARICMLGIAFKPGTDDLRDAPGLELLRRLQSRGAFVSVYDPMITTVDGIAGVRMSDSPYSAADGADAIIVATEWSEIVTVDLAELRRRATGSLLLDGRNCMQPESVRAAGFEYVGIGRGLHSRPGYRPAAAAEAALADQKAYALPG
jgi:nucleotide sugar dehydrogenase